MSRVDAVEKMVDNNTQIQDSQGKTLIFTSAFIREQSEYINSITMELNEILFGDR